MKRSLFLVAGLAMLVSAPAFAQTTTGTTANSGSVAVVNGDTIYNPGRIRNRVDQTSSGIAPGLAAAGVESCAGSVSVGVGVTGFNIGVGKTYEMADCNRRAYARSLQSMGKGLAAVAMICNNDEVAAALAITGDPCPQAVVAAGGSYYTQAAPAPRRARRK